MKDCRKQFITWLFEHSKTLYTRLFKQHKPWDISRKELLNFPGHTFGRHLGEFLKQNDFELIAKVERHDAYHTLTGLGTNVEDEIALQCLCYGNGKRSLYLYGAVILGVLILPDYWRYYKRCYQIGKAANPFHHYDFRKLLNVDITEFRAAIFTTDQLI
ncbi:MAG: hypothetical protein HRU26_05435, partial [Psychroserpens sp.]|nr:hypothetical protein [Psychroserpens sp.]